MAKPNPRSTKAWGFFNESDYKQKLDPKAREWLDRFDVEFYNDNQAANELSFNYLKIEDPTQPITLAGATGLKRSTVEEIHEFIMFVKSGVTTSRYCRDVQQQWSVVLNRFRRVSNELVKIDKDVLKQCAGRVNCPLDALERMIERLARK